MFMIMSGAVEIVKKMGGDVTNAIDEMEEQSFTVDLDESFTLDCNNLPQGLMGTDGKLHIDRTKVCAGVYVCSAHALCAYCVGLGLAGGRVGICRVLILPMC